MKEPSMNEKQDTLATVLTPGRTLLLAVVFVGGWVWTAFLIAEAYFPAYFQ